MRKSIADDIGFTAINTQGIWKDHPEKVCAFTEEFANKNPKTVKAVLKALHEASVWLDKMDNRPEQAKMCQRADLHQLRPGGDPAAACKASTTWAMAASSATPTT